MSEHTIGKDSSGSLWIYCSYAPGAGKTHHMLSEANLLAQNGTDVVIAALFDSKRSYLSAETIKEKLTSDSSLSISSSRVDFDVDVLLQRKPDLCVIDEMAAINIRRNCMVINDIADVLLEGISVFTSMNMIHLDSLAEKYLEIGACETQIIIDDEHFLSADKIVFVDIEPNELIERYKSETLYPKNQRWSLHPYFSVHRLIRYRDICLRFLEQNCICVQKRKNIYCFEKK